MKPVTDAMLHPLTLAFDQGLRDGVIQIDYALEFCNRVFDAYLEAVERRDGSAAIMHDFVLRGIVPRNKKEARHTD
ncbi:hypothetical protein PQI07_22680 [Methylobacterium sp. 092160098-2]|uniref:hypothetical protein n=1 Tax=Methylobacterium sp. 092160098-2 TaxID=3025129 RepID=UPI002381B285|nr:hypothetical protein [Methylobacterium sp. 092160098-2]MDE4913490.1 hypothetical protein [Methylobacterium sp. 092160098-2]